MWKFVRGDLSSSEFEEWLYQSSFFEKEVTDAYYLEVVSTDFMDKGSVYLLQKKLNAFLRKTFPLDCECPSLADNTFIHEGSETWEEVLKTITTIKEYGKSRSWLSLRKCNQCNQYWLYAQEDLIIDADFLNRIDDAGADKIIEKNEWPPRFQTFYELLVLGRQNNCRVDFFDPFSFSLILAVRLLKVERPDISLEEIASLLDMDKDHAQELCKKAQSYT